MNIMNPIRFSISNEIFNSSFSKVKETARTVSEKIKNNLSLLENAIHKLGVSKEGASSCSSRNLMDKITTPIQLVNEKGSRFFDRVETHLKRTIPGINDNYQEAYYKKDENLIKQNYFYAASMYRGEGASVHFQATKKTLSEGCYHEVNEITLQKTGKDTSVITTCFNEIISNLKKLGFECDQEGNYYNLKTGTMLNLALIQKSENEKEVAVCFMGLGAETAERFLTEKKKKNSQTEDKDKQELKDIVNTIRMQSMKAVLAEFFGRKPSDASKEAIEIGKIVKQASEKAKMIPVMVGHSHGGGLAQAAAVVNGIKGVVFNSRPLGAALRRAIENDGIDIQEKAGKIRAFTTRGDHVSDIKAINFLAASFERLTGIYMPRTVAFHGHVLPKPEKDKNGMRDIHMDFCSSMEVLDTKIKNDIAKEGKVTV